MQRIRQAVLYPTRDALPMLCIIKPARSIADEAPSAHLRQAIGKCVNVAINPVNRSNMLRHPIFWYFTATRNKSKYCQGKLGMCSRGGFAIVGDLTGVPEPRDICWGFCMSLCCFISTDGLKRQLIRCNRRARKTRMRHCLIKRMRK